MKKDKDSLVKQVFVTRTNGILDVSTKREFWKEIAQDIQGTFKVVQSAGNVYETLKIVVPYNNYDIILTESDTKPLKFEIEFKCELNFNIVIYKEDWLDKVWNKLGRKKLKVGSEKFNSKYFIKTKHFDKTLNLLSSKIIDACVKFDYTSLTYNTNQSKKTSRLNSVISRTINNKESLLELIDIHKFIIDQLLRLHIVRN